MKIFKKLLYVLPLSILIPLLLPTTAFATQFHFKSFTLSQEETVNEDIYAVGDTVRIDGVVNGDAVVVADVIQVNGTITGDTYLIGSKIDVDANIYGNTFIFSNNTSLRGVLTGNTYIASSFINYNAEAEKDLTAFFLESNMKGSVGDDLRAFGLRSTVDSTVRGDLLLLSSQYTSSEEKISGNIYYDTTIENIAKDQGIEFDKKIEIQKPTLQEKVSLKALTSLIGFLSMCIVGFVMIMVTPVKTVEIRKRITDSMDDFLKSLAIGLVIAILIPLPIFMLFISIVGAPLGMLVSGALLFIMIFGKIWVEVAFGKEILELFGVKEYRPFKSLLAGRVLSTIINLIPVVRGFYSSILVLVAIGAIVRMKRDYYLKAKKTK